MIGITYGTFDFLHEGHLNLLHRIKDQCDIVIVGLSTDKFNAVKGKSSYYDYHKRYMMLRDCGLVDLIIPEESWDQKSRDIIEYNVDIFFMGSDWAGRFDSLSQLCEVKYLPRTEGISSTMLRQQLK